MVLTGAGRAFSAGHDIKEASRGGENISGGKVPAEARQWIRDLPQKVTLAIKRMQKPSIAMVNGLALADAFDWILACDIRIGSENARFMNAFTRMALFPTTGGAWLLPRVIGMSKALKFLYTTDWVEAEEAHKIGLLDMLVPAAELEKETMKLARKIAEGPPISIRLLKLQASQSFDMSLETALELAAESEAVCNNTQDHREALAAFREKRRPIFIGK